MAHPRRSGAAWLDPVAQGFRLVQLAQELCAAPPALGVVGRLAFGRFPFGRPPIRRLPFGRPPVGLVLVGHRHTTTPRLGSTVSTFPRLRGLMPVRATVVGMRIHVVDHPLVAHKLTTLRDRRTDSPTFRRLADELVTLLAYEATRDVRTERVGIETPVTATEGVKLSHPRPLVVPILRAGLGMLDGMVRLLPTAEVGFLGMIRNEETLEASTYATRMPEDLSGRQVYVLDPMLATGGTLVAAIQELIKRGADDVTAVVLLAAPEGVQVMERELAGTPVTVVTAAVDERLNESGYIVPGLGDAGDRMYGTAE